MQGHPEKMQGEQHESQPDQVGTDVCQGVAEPQLHFPASQLGQGKQGTEPGQKHLGQEKGHHQGHHGMRRDGRHPDGQGEVHDVVGKPRPAHVFQNPEEVRGIDDRLGEGQAKAQPGPATPLDGERRDALAQHPGQAEGHEQHEDRLGEDEALRTKTGQPGQDHKRHEVSGLGRNVAQARGVPGLDPQAVEADGGPQGGQAPRQADEGGGGIEGLQYDAQGEKNGKNKDGPAYEGQRCRHLPGRHERRQPEHDPESHQQHPTQGHELIVGEKGQLVGKKDGHPEKEQHPARALEGDRAGVRAGVRAGGRGRKLCRGSFRLAVKAIRFLNRYLFRCLLSRKRRFRIRFKRHPAGTDVLAPQGVQSARRQAQQHKDASQVGEKRRPADPFHQGADEAGKGLGPFLQVVAQGLPPFQGQQGVGPGKIILPEGVDETVLDLVMHLGDIRLQLAGLGQGGVDVRLDLVQVFLEFPEPGHRGIQAVAGPDGIFHGQAFFPDGPNGGIVLFCLGQPGLPVIQRRAFQFHITPKLPQLDENAPEGPGGVPGHAAQEHELVQAVVGLGQGVSEFGFHGRQNPAQGFGLPDAQVQILLDTGQDRLPGFDLLGRVDQLPTLPGGGRGGLRFHWGLAWRGLDCGRPGLGKGRPPLSRKKNHGEANRNTQENRHEGGAHMPPGAARSINDRTL
ncbi:hypothetical protein ASZ90_002560 [hydrocarbon metagenome]|uniref:Uncharacterized protein n=1 Tax=hydrocarbon metagenome TaxID=938273 RepID=A0A0W8G342_9ZZZZ